MNFKRSVEEGYVRKVYPDRLKAKSLIKASEEAIATATRIKLESDSTKSIVGELYEGLRQYCEAIGYLYGYKFMSHEAITYFIEEVLGDKLDSLVFDRYRKLRNGINYYGNDVQPETVKEALREIHDLINRLSKYLKLNENQKNMKLRDIYQK
ncbi:MAG TPA: hypothetical protein VJA47_00525 [archaeon]|nr:hypothetical protein [archaeon]